MTQKRASKQISYKSAQLIQSTALAEGRLLIWTVYERPLDFPKFYVARPFRIEPGRAAPVVMKVHLQAVTLPSLRLMLPFGLSRLERNAGDDPKIVETWM